MERIAVVGCIGAGKSTVARALGRTLGIELFHVDHYWWKLVERLPQAGPVPPPEPTTAEVRKWATAGGLPIKSRGRLAPHVWAAYRDAH